MELIGKRVKWASRGQKFRGVIVEANEKTARVRLLSGIIAEVPIASLNVEK